MYTSSPVFCRGSTIAPKYEEIKMPGVAEVDHKPWLTIALFGLYKTVSARPFCLPYILLTVPLLGVRRSLECCSAGSYTSEKGL